MCQMDVRFWPVLPLLFLLVHFFTVRTTNADQSLYSQSDGLTLLSDSNFDDAVYGKPFLNFVLFYSSYCGHCIDFAPEYKRLGAMAQGWTPVIRLGAIDCSDPKSSAKCTQHDIEFYPSMKIFPPRSGSPNDGASVSPRNDRKAETLASFIAGEAAKLYRQNHFYTWPNLDYMRSDEGTTHVASQYVAVIFQNKNSTQFLGEKVALHYATFGLQLTVRIADPMHPYFAKLTSASLPALLVFDQQSQGKTVYDSKTPMTLETVVDAIKTCCHVSSVVNETSGLAATEVTTIPQMADEFHLEDIKSAVAYMFEQEIPVKKMINGDSLTALKRFLYMLGRYFPSESPRVQLAFRNLSMWIRDKDAVTADQWTEEIMALKHANAFPPEISWINCKGSKPQFRAYPCGLWMLFHSLTVRAYALDGHKPEFSAQGVLQTIAGYIQHFFTCSECAKHFGSAAAKIPQQVSVPEDVVLWLWKSHNRASHFLRGLPSEDPTHLKIQFPAKLQCPECRDNNDNWIEPTIFKFLMKFYSIDAIAEPDRSNPKFRVAKQVQSYENLVDNNHGSWYLQHPFSMCLSLLVFCTFLAVGIYLLARILRHRHFAKAFMGYRSL